MSVLSVSGLSKKFKNQPVLQNLQFSLPPATITGFLGANGAGKTTTLKCILGLMPFEQGRVLFFNQQPLSSSALQKIGFLPEKPCLYPWLTGEELLLFYARLSEPKTRSATHKSRARALLKKLGLYAVKDRALSTYSKGMLQKMGIAQALVHSPDLIILDEPLSGGLDTESRIRVKNLLQEAAQNGKSILFSTHQLYDAEELAHHLIVLKNKTLHYAGEAAHWFKKLSVTWNTDITAARKTHARLEKKFASLLQ